MPTLTTHGPSTSRPAFAKRDAPDVEPDDMPKRKKVRFQIEPDHERQERRWALDIPMYPLWNQALVQEQVEMMKQIKQEGGSNSANSIRAEERRLALIPASPLVPAPAPRPLPPTLPITYEISPLPLQLKEMRQQATSSASMSTSRRGSNFIYPSCVVDFKPSPVPPPEEDDSEGSDADDESLLRPPPRTKPPLTSPSEMMPIPGWGDTAGTRSTGSSWGRWWPSIVETIEERPLMGKWGDTAGTRSTGSSRGRWPSIVETIEEKPLMGKWGEGASAGMVRVQGRGRERETQFEAERTRRHKEKAREREKPPTTSVFEEKQRELEGQRLEQERQRKNPMYQQQEDFRKREEMKRKRQDSMESYWQSATSPMSSSPSASTKPPQRSGPTNANPNRSSTSNTSTWSSARSGRYKSTKVAPMSSTSTSSVGRTATGTPPTKPKTGSTSSDSYPTGASPGASTPFSEAEWARRHDEQAKKQQEKFRHEQERYEAEQQARSSGRVLTKEELIHLFEMHERLWTILPTADQLFWGDFPWPMTKKPSSPEDITLLAISAYILSPHFPEKVESRTSKDRLKDHLRRWHPDHIQTKFLLKVPEPDRGKVNEGVRLVVTNLNILLVHCNVPSSPSAGSDSSSNSSDTSIQNRPSVGQSSTNTGSPSDTSASITSDIVTAMDSSGLEELPDKGLILNASGLLTPNVDASFISICNWFTSILMDQSTYRNLLAFRESTAQRILDTIQVLLDDPRLSLEYSDLRKPLLVALLRLSKQSALYPTCYVLKGIQIGNEVVAAGHYGEIYEGESEGRKVCLKMVKIYKKEVERLLKAFCREAIVWKHLSHPNLLPFYGIYRLEDRHNRVCLVSPWMENGNIREFLQVNPDIARIPLIADILKGISYLHDSEDIIHGDLKGANVLVTTSGRACLADFGLSSVTDADIPIWTSIATTTRATGTVRWTAQELFSKDDEDKKPTKASDIYSFSCTCYEIFTGYIPFHEIKNDASVIAKVMEGRRLSHPSLSITNSRHLEWGMTDTIWNLIESCWHADPAMRPTAKEALDRLPVMVTKENEEKDSHILSFFEFRRANQIPDHISDADAAEIMSLVSPLSPLRAANVH